MHRCQSCKINIRSVHHSCPLCGNPLPPADQSDFPAFPEVPVVFRSYLALKIMLFLSVVVLVGSFAINQVLPEPDTWPRFVVLGLASAWLSLITLIRKRHNILKSMVWQLFILSLLAVVWDWRTGWTAWSITYLIPIASTVALAISYVLVVTLHLSAHDHIVYLLLNAVFGFAPLIFLLTNIVTQRLPSIICISASVISLAALFIFRGRQIVSQLQRRMHV